MRLKINNYGLKPQETYYLKLLKLKIVKKIKTGNYTVIQETKNKKRIIQALIERTKIFLLRKERYWYNFLITSMKYKTKKRILKMR